MDLILHFDEDESANSWQLVTLMQVPLQLLASPQYLRRAGCPKTVEELGEHELLSRTSAAHPANRWPLRSGGFIDIEPIVSSNRALVIRAMARAHQGLALLPNVRLDLLGLPKEELVPVLPNVVGRDFPLNVSLPKTSEGNLRPTRVVELIRRGIG